jgi:15-cis-phytoene synthase
MSDAAYAHCEALVRASDKDRYVASLFAPTGSRPHLFALYAFNLEIARVAEVAHTPLAGEIRLQWWYDALTSAGHGDATGHPVASAVLDTLDRCRLSAQPLLDLIEARRSDLYQEPIATLAEFDTYVRRTSTGLFATAARIVAWNGHELAQAADAAGLAYGTTTLLAVAPLHASCGHVYVPSDVLLRHGAEAADLLTGRATPALDAALAELTGRAGQHFDAFLKLAGQLASDARPALLPVAIVPLMLKRLRRRGDGALSVVEVAPLRRLMALLRAGWFGFPRAS